MEVREIIPADILDKLDDRRMQFVTEYAGGKSGKQAAIAAGFAEAGATVRASKLLRDPNVKAAVQAIRQHWAEKARYDLASAMREVDTGMRLAEKTSNAAAYIKGVEVKAKMSGLLNEALINLNIGGRIDICEALDEAKARVMRGRPDFTDVDELPSSGDVGLSQPCYSKAE